uniref:Craniofacial development protein 2 n=3 Tax=Cacopsylla melanoneura TaxID=428564 RepID=A0A8D8LL21_9HEMI
MMQPGKMIEIANQMNKYKLDIIALQEIRWQGQGRIEKQNFTVIYSGTDARTGLYGTGFMMTNKMRLAMLEYEAINERICKIRIKGKFRNITLISTHAPTEDKTDIVKDEFYDKLDEVCSKVHKYDTLLVLGDFNAKIGKHENQSHVAGKYTLHEENSENGDLLAQFATRHKLFIRSTTFPHKNIHLGTWKITGTNQCNQIDHVLVNRRHYSTVINIRTLRGPNCDSDHYLVKAVIRNKIVNVPRMAKNKIPRWNTELLRTDGETLEQYQQEITNKITQKRNKEDSNLATIEEEWTKIEKSVIEAANQTIGERERTRNEEWFDQECEDAIEEKNKARKQMLTRNTRRNCELYKESRRKANMVIKRKKRQHLNGKLEEVEQLNNESESRKFYAAIKKIKKTFQPKADMCKDKDGALITEEDKVLERWKEHFSDLLNTEENVPRTTEPHESMNEEATEPPTRTDVRAAIARLKNHKAPGEDTIVAELLKWGGEDLNAAIHDIVTAIWTQEKMPEKWHTGIICPVFKKGDKMECINYRGITLLSTAYKVLSSIINDKLKEITETKIGEYQGGFRPNRGTTDQLFVMRQIMENCYEYDIDLHMLFIDYKQAFDNVRRDKLEEAMKDLGITKKLINLIIMILGKTTAKVKVDNKLSEPFDFNLGVKQGDGLSTTLFIIAINHAIKHLDQRGTIFLKSTQICGYADDIVLVSRTRNRLIELYNELEEKTTVLGLEINVNKTKYMVMSTDENRRKPNQLEIGTNKFEGVTHFKYLGDILDHQLRMSSAIRERIMAGNRAYFANVRLLKSKLIRRSTKMKIYKTLIRPVVTYGSETWTLTQKDQESLRRFERKIVRRIYGAVQENETWRIRYNDEINNILHGEDIVRFIKSQRLRWYGHVERMDETRMPRKVLKVQIYGSRNAAT